MAAGDKHRRGEMALRLLHSLPAQQGTLALSEHGGLEGLLQLSGEYYDRLLEALTGKNPEFATRRLTEGGTKSQPPQTERRKLPALRFEDGAVYFGSTSLGRLPALF
ncbi:MAG: DUF2125 domain-containing protein [Methylocella sp.]